MAVCDYCAECKGPMGPLDAVIPVIVQFPGQSCVRHMDGFICGWISEFIADRDRQFLADEHIVWPEEIENKTNESDKT